MTPVMQTVFGVRGNCLAACVVSLLDKPEWLGWLTERLDGIRGHEEQRVALARWLRAIGWTCLPVLPYDEHFHDHMALYLLGVPCVASGVSLRGAGHAVVWNEGVVHDPHPSGGGFKAEPYAFMVLIPLGE